MNLLNQFTIKQVFEQMKKNGWKLEEFEEVLNEHIKVLEMHFRKLDFVPNPKQEDEILMNAIGFITDFHHAMKEVNKGKSFLKGVSIIIASK
jgi:hypothetical protein